MKIEGSFDDYLSPRIEIPAADRKISVIVDTGFNGELLLPLPILEEFSFKFSMKSEAELADGSIVESSIYMGKINWFGREKIVRAIATKSDDGVLGTEMLHSLTLFMDLDEDRVVLESKKVSYELG